MASLNSSQEGPAIKRSYQSVVDAQAPSGPKASSETYGQWALFSVSAPLASAFQQSNKDSVLKVQSTGEGELIDLIEDFNDGRIQFAFVKVKDPNSKLPKNVLIGWCGEGVPERTKGYFPGHMDTVSKIFQGYHIQITARSDRDLTPESIVKRVSDSSGAKYGGDSAPSKSSSGPPPPIASKPVFQPTKSAAGGRGFAPLGSSRIARPAGGDDENDGWGSEAPQVSRSQLEKVESAYKPVKVNMAELTAQKQEPSRFSAPSVAPSGGEDVVRGGYQPIGKVDIAALRRQNQNNATSDDRPTTVKGAYEPIGKVDIAAIRARASGGPASPEPVSASRTGGSTLSASKTGGSLSAARTGGSGQGDMDSPKSLADRSSAFTPSERLTSMPKPKVANRFGSSTSSFAGTKAPTPSGFGGNVPTTAPVLGASRVFGTEGGKTPAQIWAEKKAAQGGGASSTPSSTPAAPVAKQPSGGFDSGYGGKKWGAVQIPKPGKSLPAENDEASRNPPAQDDEDDTPGGVSAVRDRFKNAAPIGMGKPPTARQLSTFEDDEEQQEEEEAPRPPPMNMASKPNAGARGVPIPGMARSAPPLEVDDDDDVPAEEPSGLPVPPPPQPPRTPEPEEDEEPERSDSPIRVAMPVGRTAAPAPMRAPSERFSPPPMPIAAMGRAVPKAADLDDEPQDEDDDPARGASQAAAATTFGAAATQKSASSTGGKRALAQFDYEKAEENELELHEGDQVTNIEMVDEDWWMGENPRGERGLFPSNYVELVEGGEEEAPAPAPQAAHHEAPAAAAAPPAPSGGASHEGATATAQYDYEAVEDNEISFPDGATITNVEFPDEDWWMGEYNGKKGLFPANYVQLDE